jgi:hypothetical protein
MAPGRIRHNRPRDVEKLLSCQRGLNSLPPALALDDPTFGAQLREWLKTLRKKNASVVFATAKIIFNSFSGLGLKAAGSGLTADQFLQPGRIAQVGIDVSLPILQAAGSPVVGDRRRDGPGLAEPSPTWSASPRSSPRRVGWSSRCCTPRGWSS